ncbi:hypothetical protein ACWC5C_20640 [Streptomyces sp. NPDC001700]
MNSISMMNRREFWPVLQKFEADTGEGCETLYETYGDRGPLAENFDAAVRWVEWALATARTACPSHLERSAEPLPHEEFVWDGSFHWGEWCEPNPRAADGSPIDARKQNRAA